MLEFAPRENCRGKAEMLLLLYRPFIRKGGGDGGVAVIPQYLETELTEIC